MGSSRAGGKRKKRRTHAKEQELDTIDPSKRPPKSFVFTNGEVPKEARNFVADLKDVMEPNTASSLKSGSRNVLKDFVQIAGPLGVTHLLPVGSGTRGSLNLRIARLPRGPTLTFRVTHFNSAADVAAAQRKPASVPDAFLNSPLVILNNFGGNSPHVKLMAVMLQNLFPSINVSEVNLAACRRVVLFHLDKESGEVEFRHYFIRTKPVGHSKQIKRVLKKSKNLDLSNLDDIGDMLEADDGYATSDSEAEDNHDSHVTIPQDTKRGRRAATRQSAVRLQEIGPRFRLNLIKIEDAVFDGDIIYHAFEKKTPEEAAKLRMMRKQRDREKEKRRTEQEANVLRKKKKMEALSLIHI
eukprot:TRINITY_DN49891_c0_g1_i2.p1 TRINITY_DN49891_c0_g1~~TRINITY_DN49891_c0_g1_i2.p1  ORF type:complete len:355 (+),score=78.91 TRINITY_DN49891_c0_g1_i2:124-1188(+)